MFRLEKEFRFEASHQLLRHKGKCARMHGHSWVGRLVAEGPALQTEGPATNMLLDFGDLGYIAKELSLVLDHHHLNDVLKTDSPTCEFLAQWCFVRAHDIARDLDFDVSLLKAVVIEETCTSRCEYRYVHSETVTIQTP